MEDSGREPDVVAQDPKRMSSCSVIAALRALQRVAVYVTTVQRSMRAKRISRAVMRIELAREIGAEILNEQEYRYLQTLGEFDKKLRVGS